MALILRGTQLQPFADEHAATLFTDSLFAQYRADIACPSCNVKNGLHFDQNCVGDGKARRRYKHKCRTTRGDPQSFTMGCGNMLLNCIIPLFERCIERARDSASPTAAVTKATAERYISLSLLACQRFKLEGARFDYQAFEERLQALVVHDTQLKAAVDAGLLLNDARRRVASTQPPEIRAVLTTESSQVQKPDAVASCRRRREEPPGRATVTVRDRKRSRADRVTAPANHAAVHRGEAASPAPETVVPAPSASEVAVVATRSTRKPRTGVPTAGPTSRPKTCEPHIPLASAHNSCKGRPRVTKSRTSREQSVHPDESRSSALTSTLLTLLTAVGANSSSPGITATISISDPPLPPLLSTRPPPKTQRSQLQATGDENNPFAHHLPQQLHFHISLGAGTLTSPSPVVCPLSQKIQTKNAVSSRRSIVRTLPRSNSSMLAAPLEPKNSATFRIMYLNVQGLTLEKWDALFHAFQASQHSAHQSSLLLIAESHGPNREVREALAAEPFGWIKAMSAPSSSDEPMDRPRQSTVGQSTRRGGLLIVARPDLLVTMHRITPYCCTLSVLPAGTFCALLIHAVYLPPSMGHFEDWSLFKTFLAPSDRQSPDILLGDVNVRFPTGNMELDKAVGPKARLQVVEDCISKLGLRRMIASKESMEDGQISSRVDHAFVKQCSTFEASLQFKQAMIKTDHPLMKVTLKIVPGNEKES
ncbi:hypothetical protein BCV69DRAFT_298264 [Microstroma glucosiphilum]|uniref:Endonuclease/exonuclease/phosphatase domain-containing protein n=1 Tax=Pseudomicrostroma glucosiphilum TaxID=1684307 RepID=A0A316UC86_9BASI|nr:hypothetical protein BCV69DRAFT_298264 [Pseudomicrostroma glucosiphilum]PWN22071.1 hypothetical protein BCV69DRAFT_298264 [Pseudomicrostroma glucosiphilum]